MIKYNQITLKEGWPGVYLDICLCVQNIFYLFIILRRHSKDVNVALNFNSTIGVLFSFVQFECKSENLQNP